MKQGLIILAVLILAGVGFVLTREDNSNETNNTNTTQQPESTQSPSPQPSETATEAEAKTITYTNSGFSPNTLTVNSGDTVTIKNDSSSQLQFASDPHPQHTDNTELNVGVIAPGESKTFTVNTKGTHGYHNHLNSGDTGTLVVQ